MDTNIELPKDKVSYILTPEGSIIALRGQEPCERTQAQLAAWIGAKTGEYAYLTDEGIVLTKVEHVAPELDEDDLLSVFAEEYPTYIDETSGIFDEE